jgi:hypothetical protein
MEEDGGLRFDGYVRVSQVRGREGPTFISPSVQRERIAAWLTAHGHHLGELFEELDQSAKRGHGVRYSSRQSPGSRAAKPMV